MQDLRNQVRFTIAVSATSVRLHELLPQAPIHADAGTSGRSVLRKNHLKLLASILKKLGIS